MEKGRFTEAQITTMQRIFLRERAERDAEGVFQVRLPESGAWTVYIDQVDRSRAGGTSSRTIGRLSLVIHEREEHQIFSLPLLPVR